jgi:myo-inositol-1(or 4)-monophosphatase
MDQNHVKNIFNEMTRCVFACENYMKVAFPDNLNVTAKEDGSFVTAIDKKIQEYIIEQLKSVVPNAFFIAEEKDNIDDFTGEGFIIDPIDGTHNFINGIPLCAICVAYVNNNEVLASVVYNPFLNEFFTAVKGQGAKINNISIHYRDRKLSQSIILTEDNWDANKSVLKNYACGYRCLGSAALAICYVACGRAAGYISSNINIWDYAASKLILEEAGGILIEKDGHQAQLKQSNQVAACSKDNADIFWQIWQEAEEKQKGE